MIGEVKIIGREIYCQINEEGTLEKLLPIPWYRVLQLYIWTHFKKRAYGEVKGFIKKYMKGGNK